MALSFDIHTYSLLQIKVTKVLEFQNYSAAQKKRYEYCFMKQKWESQIGKAHYRNAATLLSILGINTTHHT